MLMNRKTLLMAGAGFAIATAGIVLFMKAQKEKKFSAPEEAFDDEFIDKVTRGYLGCALWSSDDDEGDPLDGKYDRFDFDDESVEKAKKDIRMFMDKATVFFMEDEISDPDHIGHDLWLTRNGHGAGFWDGDYEQGKELSEICDEMGGADAFETDDGGVAIESTFEMFKAPTNESEWSWSDEVKRLTGQLDDFPYGSDQIYIEFSLMDNKTQEKQLYELSDYVSAGILYHDKESLTDEITDALTEYSEKQGWPYEGIDFYSINIEK